MEIQINDFFDNKYKREDHQIIILRYVLKIEALTIFFIKKWGNKRRKTRENPKGEAKTG